MYVYCLTQFISDGLNVLFCDILTRGYTVAHTCAVDIMHIYSIHTYICMYVPLMF